MHFSGETSRKNLFTVIKSVLLMFVARSRQKFFFEFEDHFAGFTVFFCSAYSCIECCVPKRGAYIAWFNRWQQIRNDLN